MKSPVPSNLSLKIGHLTPKVTYENDIKPLYFESRSKPEILPSDYYLKRNEMLDKDRTRQKTYMCKSPAAKDVSYLYESILRQSLSISPTRDLLSYPLPTEINELQLLLNSEDYDIENIFKRTKSSRPYGRKDAVDLANWLNDMHNKFLRKLDKIMQDKDIVEVEFSETIEAIYLIALKESIKQIAVNCLERAVMLHRIFEILGYTWKKAPDDLQRKIESIKLKHQQDLAKFKKKYNAKYALLEKNCEDLKAKIEESHKESELLKNETNILKKHLNQLRSDNEVKKYDRKQSKIIAKKVTADVEIQTDPVSESESSEESSEEPNNEVLVDQASITRMLTRQRTLSNEKRPEHLVHLKKHIDLANCSGQLVIDDLYQYITSEYVDFYAWVDGFRLAAEIMQNKPKNEENPSENMNPNTSSPKNLLTEAQSLEPKYEEKKKAKEKKFFKFKANYTIAQQLTENSPNEMIINNLSELPIKKIVKASNMTSKKLSNQITLAINIARNKTFEQFPTFSIFVYSLLFQKYSVKQIADRKFKELTASCIKYADDKKVQIFLRMIGAGVGLGLSTFSNATCKMCIKIYDFMMCDKTGFVSEGSPARDSQFYPVSRAFECIKQLFDPLLIRPDTIKLKKKIESLTINDPDEMNRTGLIDLQAFVLCSVEAFQEYTEKVIKGVKKSAEVLTEFKYITWQEANILVRNINPKKELKEIDRTLIEMNQIEEIEIEKFSNFCIQKGVLRIEDYERFFSRATSMTSVEIIEKIREIKEILPEVLEKVEESTSTICYDDWDGRFDDITIGLKGKSSENAIRLWTLLYSEFIYLLNKSKN